MIKWYSALIFINFILNCNSVTLWNSQVDSHQAVAALDLITDHKKVLPLPLCLVPGRETLILRSPEDIEKAEIENGVMVWGTEFSHRHLQFLLYFCPSRIPGDSCLQPVDPEEFNNSEPLVCTEEPKADVVWDEEHHRRICNFRDGIFSHRVIYKICDSDFYNYTTKEFVVYQFCYDEGNAKTLFTRHSILSPKLLFSPLLIREEQLQYPYAYEDPINGFLPANHIEITNAGNMQIRRRTLRQRYRPQRLVPDTDMALGVWKKTTSQPLNYKLQHETMGATWREINQKLREQANAHRSHGMYIISTGVFENKMGVESPPNGQMYNRWVKLVIYKSLRDNRVHGGSVFMINNFLDHEFEHDQHQLLSLQFEMQEYCPRDYCKNELIRLASVARVTMRCCEVTKKIGKLFGFDFPRTLEFLPIEGLSSITE